METEFKLYVSNFDDKQKWEIIKQDVSYGEINKVRIADVEFIRVVRCADCKYRRTGYTYDGCFCDHLMKVVEPDWYCADGEMRK